ncbi:MAG: hypothetical protein WCQ72_08010 [Eubacteriales bacterium]
MTYNPPEKRSRRWTFGEIVAIVLAVLIAAAAAAAALYGAILPQRSKTRAV